MIDIGDIAARLVAAGVQPELAASAVAQAFAAGAACAKIETPTDPVRERRRAYDRDRQRLRREKESLAKSADIRRQSADADQAKAGEKSTDSPPTSADIRRHPPTEPESALILTSLPFSSDSLKEEQAKEEKKERKVSVRKSPSGPLSADWEPNQKHFEAAEGLNIPSSAVLEKAEDMRIWAKSSGAMKVDWDATFHGFLRRDAPRLASGGGYGQPRRSPAPNRADTAVQGILNSLNKRYVGE